MNSYPAYFLPLLWTGVALLILTGLLLGPGIFELRLEWDVPLSVPGGSRAMIAATHGFCAMAFLIVLGALLPVHVRSGLRVVRNFASGIVLLSALATLALSGWAIYYIIDEDLAALASLLHLGVGLVSLLPLSIHAVRGRGVRKEREVAKQASQASFLSERRGKRVA